MRRFATLSRQADFARLRRHGRRLSTRSLVIYRSDPLSSDQSSVVGITVGRSIGKAVVRNKLRRRIAAIIHDALKSHEAVRLLVVPRPIAAAAPFSELQVELVSALGRR